MSNINGLQHVDNILKMLLGVLSVAGLIALIIPEKNPLPPEIAETQARAEASATELAPQLPSPAPDPAPVQFDSDPVSNFQIGAPTIDGNPMQPDFGMPFGTSAQASSTNADTEQASAGGYTPPVFAMPGAPIPNEASNADVVTGNQ